MLLSLLLADRISALKRQTRSAFIIATAFTSATHWPLLISGKCLSSRLGKLSRAHGAWQRGNCLCHCLRGTGWVSPGGRQHQKPAAGRRAAWPEPAGGSWWGPTPSGAPCPSGCLRVAPGLHRQQRGPQDCCSHSSAALLGAYNRIKTRKGDTGRCQGWGA